MGTRKTTRQTRTKLTTPMADLGSVVRLNLNNFNTFSFSFVLDETLQLKEAPIANPIVHSLSSSLLSDTFEVFNYNLVSVEVGNNIFTDFVINFSHKPLLLSRQLLEKSSGTSSAFGLKFTTQVFELPLDLLDLCRIIKPAVRSDSKVIYSAVNTKNSILDIRAFGSDCFRECEQEETPAFFIYPKQTFSDIPTEVFFIAVGDSERDFNSAFDCSKTKNIVFEGCRTREIISHRTSVDNWFGFSLFDHSTRLLNTSNSELAFESITFENMVDKRMELDVVPYLVFPSSINTKLQTFSIDSESVNYLWCCSNLNFSCCPDVHNGCKTERIYKDCGSVMQKASNGTAVTRCRAKVRQSDAPEPRKITDTSIPPNLKRLGILEVFL